MLRASVQTSITWHNALSALAYMVEGGAAATDGWKQFALGDAERLEAMARDIRATIASKPPEHHCGIRGWNPMLDPPCPACEAMSKR